MNKNTSNKSAARGRTSPLLTGILVGILIGAALAAGLAWYILRAPSPFLPKNPIDVHKPPSEMAPSGKSSDASPLQADDSKPRFEFYKVLTDKQDASLPATGQSKPAPAASASQQSQYWQAGSFSTQEDAEKLKAKLALLGMETSVQTVTIPDKGVRHRVRIGPYQDSREMEEARITLKQNGMEVTPMPAQ